MKTSKRGLNKQLLSYRWLRVDLLFLSVKSERSVFLIKQCIKYREGNRNTEMHGKRFVKSAGVNLTWSTSAWMWSLKKRYYILSVLLIISKYCSLKNFQLQFEISIRSHEALFERHQLVFILLFNIPCYTPSEFKMSEVFSLIKYELVELIQSYTCPFAF
jgi:hypothetical protein